MNEKISYQLLARFFAGECSDEDFKQLEEWRKENPSNEKAFIELSEIWENSNTKDHDFNPDIADALKKVDDKIEQIRLPFLDSNKLRNIIYYTLRIAAVIIISLAIWYGYNRIIQRENWITEINEDEEIKELILPDGTKITLNTGSYIKYPKNFDKISRNVELEGEAYFEVKKSTGKAFIISAQNSETKVLGTTFNLRALPDEEEIVLTVEEGKVTFSTIKDDKIVAVDLEAGDRGIISKTDKSITEVKNNDINYTAWKTGRLLFRNTPLKKVAQDLSGFYKARFVLESIEYDAIKVTIVFDHSSIEEVIEAMDFIGIQIIKKDGVYSISGSAVQ